MKQFYRHIITWLTVLIVLFRLTVPVFGMVQPCDISNLAEQKACEILSDDPVGSHTNCPSSQLLYNHDFCCCQYESLPEIVQEPSYQVPSFDYKFSPVVFTLLKTLAFEDLSHRTTSSFLPTPEIPAFSSRQILTLQSVLLI